MSDKINSSRIKQINLQLIRNCLLECDSATKQEIASYTALSLATCTVLLDELICEDEVIELKHDASRGGRPARRVMLNADKSHILVIILKNERSVRLVQWRIVDLKETQLDCGEIKTEKLGPFILTDIIKNIIDENRKVKAIGIGIPGIVLDGKMTICDIKELMGEDTIRRLETEIKLPMIFGNDMNSIAYGYYKKYAYPQNVGVASMVWTKGECGGAGSVVNGKILEGWSNFAGEISYLPFGVKRDEQPFIQNNKDEFIKMAARAICSVVVILNPKLIVLTGELSVEHSCAQYINECKKHLPKEHLPTLVITDNVINEYFDGIYHMVMERIIYLEK